MTSTSKNKNINTTDKIDNSRLVGNMSLAVFPPKGQEPEDTAIGLRYPEDTRPLRLKDAAPPNHFQEYSITKSHQYLPSVCARPRTVS